MAISMYQIIRCRNADMCSLVQLIIVCKRTAIIKRTVKDPDSLGDSFKATYAVIKACLTQSDTGVKSGHQLHKNV
jgi:hypothetical protein